MTALVGCYFRINTRLVSEAGVRPTERLTASVSDPPQAA